MALNDQLMLQQPEPLNRVEWSALDDAYPWVISHRLFPIALLDHDPRWRQVIAWECQVSEGLVQEIIELERSKK